jgi:hypothetical protein
MRPSGCDASAPSGWTFQPSRVSNVNVADDVERPGRIAPVGPEPLAHDGRAVDLVGAVERVRALEAFAVEVVHRSAERVPLISDHVRPEVVVRASRVAFATHLGRHIEHDGDREDVMATGKLHQRLAVFGAYAGRVDDHDAARFEALGGDRVQHLERRGGRGLVVLVVGDELAAEVGRHDLGRTEVPRRERRLPRSGDTDKSDETQLGNGDRRAHRRNTAIWVGVPRAASTGPMPECVTV